MALSKLLEIAFSLIYKFCQTIYIHRYTHERKACIGTPNMAMEEFILHNVGDKPIYQD